MPNSLRSVLSFTLGLVCCLLFFEVVARVAEVWLGQMTGAYQLEDVDILVEDGRDPTTFMTSPVLTGARISRYPLMAPQRFQGTAAPASARVLLLGGSSVFNLHDRVDDLREAILDHDPGEWRDVELIIGGVNGGGTDAALYVLDGMRQLRPDVVVIYSGHNEFYNGLYHLVDEAHSGQAWWQNLAMVRVGRPIATQWRLWFMPPKGFHPERAAARDARIHTPKAALTQEIAEAPAVRSEVFHQMFKGVEKPLGNQVPQVLSRYESNLAMLVTRTRDAGATPILATVPGNVLALGFTLLGGEADERLIAAEQRFQSGDVEAAAALLDDAWRLKPRIQATSAELQIVRHVARQHGVVVADVYEAIAQAGAYSFPGPVHFADHCHLDYEGNTIWIEAVSPVVAAALRERPVP